MDLLMRLDIGTSVTCRIATVKPGVQCWRSCDRKVFGVEHVIAKVKNEVTKEVL